MTGFQLTSVLTIAFQRNDVWRIRFWNGKAPKTAKWSPTQPQLKIPVAADYAWPWKAYRLAPEPLAAPAPIAAQVWRTE